MWFELVIEEEKNDSANLHSTEPLCGVAADQGSMNAVEHQSLVELSAKRYSLSANGCTRSEKTDRSC